MAEVINQTSISREAPFLEDYRRRLMDSVFKATDKRIDPLGRTIEGFQPFQQAGFGIGAQQLGFTFDPTTGGLTQTGQAVFDPALTKGQQTAELGIPALASAQQQYDPATSNYKDFFNQYQSDVTQQALKQIDEEGQKARNRLSGEATRAGVFGGSRFGVQQAELDKSIQDIKSKRIAEDLSRNFMQAQQASMNTFEQARARNLAAAQGLGTLGSQIGSFGAQRFGLGQQGLAGLMGMGQQQQTLAQAQADEQFRLGTARQQEPLQRLGVIGDFLSRVPSAQMTTNQQPIPYTNPIIGAVGAGMAGLGSLMGATS
jgi:hypothetical protein